MGETSCYPQKPHRLLNKSQVSSIDYLLLSCWSGDYQRDPPQTIEPVVIILGCPSELETKSLFL